MNKWKKFLLSSGILSLALILSACGTSDISAQSEGIWEGTILYNFSRIIIGLSELFDNNYALGIILFVIIIRIILLPATYYQMKSTRKMQELNPQIEKLKETYAGKDAQTQEKLQEETARLYKEEGVNPLMSALPLLLQMPILLALYQTISRTPILRQGSFLWTNLGEMDPYFIFPILAAILMWYSTHLTSMTGNQGGNSMMSYVMPIIILFISIPLPSALSLYFVVTNAFTVVQTLILSNPYKVLREQAAKEAEQREKDKNRKNALRKARKRKRSVRK